MVNTEKKAFVEIKSSIQRRIFKFNDRAPNSKETFIRRWIKQI